ncbi:MAG: hypothetical protein HYU97_05210 [Deltaproteobacteria bacterium]|nr:hypothetical protein [Deltaproteobacteria bacterium]
MKKFLSLSIVFATLGMSSFNIIPHDFMNKKPAPGETFFDAKFGYAITRISKPPNFTGRCLVPEYSKRQVFNADESWLRLQDCDGRTLIYDAKNYQFKKILKDEITGAQDIFWHPSLPHLLYFNTEATLKIYDINTDTITPVFTFKNPQGAPYVTADTFAEGNLSNDGRYYAVMGRMGDHDFKEILVLDIFSKTLVSRRNLPTGIDFVDWVSISPLGHYVVVDYATSARGVEVYPLDLTKLLWTKPLGTGHSDLGLDADGSTEILVMDVYDPNLNKTVIKKFLLRDGQTADLLNLGLFDLHISCRNIKRPGWCYMSVFDMNDQQSTDATHWDLFADEIFALKLDGSAIKSPNGVERLAHHHSRRYGNEGVYAAEPHATVSAKGDRIVFGSNWRENIYQETSIDPYVLDLRNKR